MRLLPGFLRRKRVLRKIEAERQKYPMTLRADEYLWYVNRRVQPVSVTMRGFPSTYPATTVLAWGYDVDNRYGFTKCSTDPKYRTNGFEFVMTVGGLRVRAAETGEVMAASVVDANTWPNPPAVLPVVPFDAMHDWRIILNASVSGTPEAGWGDAMIVQCHDTVANKIYNAGVNTFGQTGLYRTVANGDGTLSVAGRGMVLCWGACDTVLPAVANVTVGGFAVD